MELLHHNINVLAAIHRKAPVCIQRHKHQERRTQEYYRLQATTATTTHNVRLAYFVAYEYRPVSTAPTMLGRRPSKATENDRYCKAFTYLVWLR